MVPQALAVLMLAEIWSKTTCIFCDKAKTLLTERNIPYEERLLGEKWSKEDLLEKVPNAKTVPQIFIDNVYIGGYTDLVEFLDS